MSSSLLRERMALLEELGQIVNAMKNLAYAQLQRLARLLEAQAEAEDVLRQALASLPAPGTAGPGPQAFVGAGPEHYHHLFGVGHSITGLNPVAGNSGTLMADSNATIDAMVADIDAAMAHVHLLFYIWLPDNNGRKVAHALIRAAGRGVACRAMVDDLGSRLLLGSEHWRAMHEAGVQLARALPVGNPLLRPFRGRIDLRNHRKIVVIDDRITYCLRHADRYEFVAEAPGLHRGFGTLLAAQREGILVFPRDGEIIGDVLGGLDHAGNHAEPVDRLRAFPAALQAVVELHVAGPRAGAHRARVATRGTGSPRSGT